MGNEISCVSGNAPWHPDNSGQDGQLSNGPLVLTAAEYLIGQTDVSGTQRVRPWPGHFFETLELESITE